ncbi:hypothetical protein ACFVTJ_23280 [Agrobacterium sp. NPDC058088]|uniref:hypothetical protein n=1 Tax=Agrobacterium sp. NPDC058088 TaxID=3346335 RepID=UPI0036DDAF5C
MAKNHPRRHICRQSYLRPINVSGKAQSRQGLTFVRYLNGDGDGHLGSLPEHISARHPAQRMSKIHHRDIAKAITLALEGDFDRRIEAPVSAAAS